MLLSMLFDDEDESVVSALFQVGDQVLHLKQKPHEGREYNKEKEDLQEYAMTHPDECQPSSSGNGGEYDSAFPNVGLVVWQAGFVLGEYLLRAQPLGPWSRGQKVLELGCGTGQLGIVLALAGAAVTLTDLDHIVPLTQGNVDLNVARCSVVPVCAPYFWGTPAGSIPQAGQQHEQHEQQQQQGQEQEQPSNGEQHQQQEGLQQQQQQQHWDAIVAADVLYEPHHYDKLLDSLMQLCQQPTKAAAQQQQGGQDTANNAASPPVYICYRVRLYDEHGFEAKAVKCGFRITAVPTEELHADYQCGGYRLICLHRE